MKNRKSGFTMTLALIFIEFKAKFLLVVPEEIFIKLEVLIVEYAENHFFD